MRGGFGGGRGGGEQFGGRGEGRRHRMFDREELRLVLLKLIADEPRHGYDLIRAIEERTGGAYAPSPGVVYPTLTLITDMGLIAEGDADGARRTFTATDAGRALLVERAELVAQLFARLDALAERAARTSAGPISRAIANLHAVVRNRAGREEEQAVIHDIAEILDDAARRIERL